MTAPGPGGGDAFDQFELGDGCPVQPLGFLLQRNFFLDFAGQLIELGSEFRKGELMQLFGTKQPWLEARWPTKKEVVDKRTQEREWIITGFDQKLAQKGMIVACAKAGLFDPTGKVRGRGAHRGTGGELVLHCGAQIMVGGQRGTRNNVKRPTTHRPGLLSGYVYPTAPALAVPAEVPASGDVARQVLQILETWRWKDGATSAYLLLCWIAAASIGGALRNRPHVWITGPSGAGKTTLQQLMRELMGDFGIFTEDATEAGVRQLLNQDTLAVMFDEIEPDEGNADVHMKIVKLARLAYSGSSSLRGGQDHKSKQFVAQSCFLFSSIHHHELPAQDRNRMAVLSLREFPKGTTPLVLPRLLKEWGSALRRRLIEQWHRFDATLLRYQEEMLRQGYSGREQDTYGTLLAAGDLLLHDAAPGDFTLNDDDDERSRANVPALVKQLGGMVDKARSEAESTTDRCVRHLTSHRLPARPGEAQETIGRWIMRALADQINGGIRVEAMRRLETHGIRLFNLREGHEAGQSGMVPVLDVERAYLAVAGKTNKNVAEIFRDSTWQGGVWSQALSLIPGAFNNKRSRFSGAVETCVLVPVTGAKDSESIVDLDEVKRWAVALRADSGAV